MSKIESGLCFLLVIIILLGCVSSDQLAQQPTSMVASPTVANLPTVESTRSAANPTATPLVEFPTDTASDVQAPAPLPSDVQLWRKARQAADYETVTALAETYIPMRDLRDLAIRLRGVRADTPKTINQATASYSVGAVRSFKASNQDTMAVFIIEAELRYATEHLYMWVERGVKVDQNRLEQAADTFENEIYTTTRAFFGSEWTPGVDGDPHLGILHARNLGAVAGLYWSADQYTLEVRPDSNQMEMFYINADNANVGSKEYLGTLAHEFQHMIHWYNDRNEETWLNEGCSELAMQINHIDVGNRATSWAANPDTQLNTWSDDSRSLAHYGASFMFMSYFLGRFGETMTQALVAHPDNGIASVDAVLAEAGLDLTFRDVFADWLVASYVNAPDLTPDGRFGYALMTPPMPQIDVEHETFPTGRLTKVAQYGVDYIYLQGGQDLILDFYGNTRVRLLPTTPHSGDFVWYANRGDDCDMRLTRSFDLSGLEKATLCFWTWYDIERNWDYGYVLVSADEGKTWKILRGLSTVQDNPSGNSYGWGYTGVSGNGPSWIEEKIDLSDYAGEEILLRFEYITDDALNNSGWIIDDIAIPELTFVDDVETNDNNWLAEGFVRTNNIVPQSYLVQLVTLAAETTIERLPLRDDQTARWRLPLAQAEHAILLVSGLAPVTTEPSDYYYRLEVE